VIGQREGQPLNRNGNLNSVDIITWFDSGQSILGSTAVPEGPQTLPILGAHRPRVAHCPYPKPVPHRSATEHRKKAFPGIVIAADTVVPMPMLAQDTHADSRQPDLMILDVLVDRACTGVEAAHNALQRFPGVKILLTSAIPPQVWPDSVRLLFETLPEHSCTFLSKPFTAQQLNAAVAALLDRTEYQSSPG